MFLAYLAAVFHERGLSDVQKWIGALLRVTKVHSIDIGLDDFEEQAGKRVKAEEPAPGSSAIPMTFTPPAPAKMAEFAMMKHYNPYANQPAPPMSAPPPLPPQPSQPQSLFASNPLSPAQPHLAFLPLFNQTASQRGLSVEYPAIFSGPSHAGKWNVTCIGELSC